jgi:hypothetical protein
MKQTIILGLIVAGFSLNGIAQNCSLDASISNIRSLLNEQRTGEEIEVEWLKNQHALKINNHVFPVSDNTHTKLRSDNKVEFFLQKGTAITDVRDTTFRRAYWQITFASKNASKQFVKYFDCLKQL